jgi:membrane protein
VDIVSTPPGYIPMLGKKLNTFRNLGLALKEFYKQGGIDKASVLAYYSIFSSLFLFTFATLIFTKILGDPDFALKSVYPFSPAFFTEISPGLFSKAQEISTKFAEIGIIGIVIFIFLGFLIIKKVVQYVNEMCDTHLEDFKKQKGFWIRRISEFGLLFILGILVIFNFLTTNFISFITSIFENNEFLASHINPHFIEFLNKFLILYIVPIFINFIFFFVLYKWIPEKKIYVKGALISAVIVTLLWEIIKRGYTYYLVNVSVIGKIKGPLIAIILFGFWMEISLALMLYGARLTYIFDREHHARS